MRENGGTIMRDLDLVGIITALGGAAGIILRAVATRRSSRTGELERRVDDLERQLLAWAEWGHTARMQAAASGCRLPAIPAPRTAGDMTREAAA